MTAVSIEPQPESYDSTLTTRNLHLLDPTGSLPVKWNLNLSHGLSSVHECDRRQADDGQTTLSSNVQ